jgi:urate oxidase
MVQLERISLWARSPLECQIFSVCSRLLLHTAHISLNGLGSLVLKSTGSAFEGFYRDEYTTLTPVNDRIFSTSVDLTYTFADIALKAPTDEKKFEFVIPLQKGEEGYAGSVWDEEVPARARTATLETFAVDESASVQVCSSLLILEIVFQTKSNGRPRYIRWDRGSSRRTPM